MRAELENRDLDGPTATAPPPPATEATRPARHGGLRPLGTTVRTPRDALRLDELQSTRVFLLAAVVLAAIVSAALPFLDGDPVAMFVLVGGIALALAAVAWTALALREPPGYTERHAIVLASCSALAGWTAIYYFGVLSAASLATTMGIFFFAITHDRRPAIMAFALGAVGPPVLWLLVITGAVNDRSVLPVADVSHKNQVLLLLLLETVFGITYFIARGSRRSRVRAVEELEVAVRQVAQREALLDEARRELDQALRVGGPGRFTDQQLGAFRLGVLVGRGAMGEVYEAAHVDTDARAAVKLLNRSVLGDPEQVHRFVREAQIAARLRTPHVVEVLEIGDERASLPFIAMELLDGEDLAQILRRDRVLDEGKVIQMAAQVGAGIDAAHAAGVVHRDLKPQNVFLHRGSVWKILDFGVSRLIESDGTLTRGQAIGTPSYMAPEQARGLAVDHRADLFAVGVLAYRCLTGRPAFTGRDVPTILHRVVYAMPPRPTELAALPDDVDAVLAIALAKDPGARFATGAELAAAIAAALRGELADELRARAAALTGELPWGGQRP